VKKLKVLDLFSGIGGFSLGLERTGGFETVAFCEIEKFPQKVLRKHWPEVPIFEDVRKLDATRIGRIDCVVGGFPCQPWSLAGERKGTEDDRDLWPEMLRVITATQPEWVIGENVRGFVNEPMGLERSIFDLEDAEYKVQTFIVPACAVDAPHRRDRVWIVANARRKYRGKGAEVERGLRGKSQDGGSCNISKRSGATPNVAHAKKLLSNGGDSEPRRKKSQSADNSGATRGCAHWLPEPRVGRVAHGVPNRSHRLKGLGNAVVPQIPEMIGRAILKSYES
jgi:DNA (cytosine-5)-methyltransferase 1